MANMSRSRKPKADPRDGALMADWEAAAGAWGRAVGAHRMAPPDAGFAGRLAEFAASSREFGRVCRLMARDGYVWPSARKADADPPYELRPGTGRRGPAELWGRFDVAARAFVLASAGTDLLEVAEAYEGLGAIAKELAAAVATEDAQASGVPASKPRARRRA